MHEGCRGGVGLGLLVMGRASIAGIRTSADQWSLGPSVLDAMAYLTDDSMGKWSSSLGVE